MVGCDATFHSYTGLTEIVLARDMVTEVEHSTCGKIKLVNTPVKYSHSKPSIRKAPPLLGEDTAQVLEEVLGLNEEEINDMKAEGVVR